MASQVSNNTDNSSNWKQNIIGLTSATTGGALAFYGGKKLIGIPFKNMQKNLISDAVSSNSIFKDSAIKVLNDNKIIIYVNKYIIKDYKYSNTEEATKEILNII